MKKNLLDFSRLHHFLSFEESTYAEDNQYPSALGHTTGSYLSTLMTEHQNPSRTLKSLRSLDQTMSKLTQVVREELATAEKELLPDIHRQGLYSLPFKILERIFGLISDEGYADLVDFMLVNRFFRDTVRRIPYLWTNVCDFENPGIYLERSQSQGLFVGMSRFSDTGPEFDRCLDVLAPEWERWRSLTITTDWGMDVRLQRLQRLRQEFSGRTFPALERLEVRHRLLWEPEAVNGEILSFFSSWNMPALRCFSATGFVPSLPPACSPTITRFQLKLEMHFDIDAVGDVLRVLRDLEELSLDVCVGDEPQGVEVKHVALPSLRVLRTLTLGSNYELIAPLINALDMPNLRELDLKILADKEDKVPDLQRLFERRPFWAQLETLQYSIQFDPRTGYHADAVISRLPSRLQHLTLWDLPPPPRSFWHVDDGPPPLRSLGFRNCSQIDTAHVLELGPVIFCPSFETLEIIDCPNINADILQTVMPEGVKLNYEEHNWDLELQHFRKSSRPGRCDHGTSRN